MNKIPLTVIGAERLRVELQQLKTVERPNVIAAIAEARSHGDLSENAEYDAAKERQGFIEGRIKEIEAKLNNAQIIDPKTLGADGRCVFGSTVDLEDQDSGEKVCYQIVGEDEADIREGKVSVNSPLARALIGKHAGDIAQVQTPGGLREYELVDVRYEKAQLAPTVRSFSSDNCAWCCAGPSVVFSLRQPVSARVPDGRQPAVCRYAVPAQRQVFRRFP